MSTYKEPKVRVTQSFENQSTSSSTETQNVCIVGPAYLMADETHSISYNFPASPIDLIYSSINGNHTVDIRQVDPDDEELIYFPSVTFKSAKVKRGDALTGSIQASSGKLVVSSNVFTWDFTNKNTVMIIGATITHSLGTPVSVTSTGAGTGYDIVFSTPVGIGLDAGGTYYDAGSGNTATVNAISADGKKISVTSPTGSFETTTMVTGHKITNTISSGTDEFVISKIDSKTVSISAIPDNVAYTITDFDVFEYKDVEIDTTNTAYATVTSTKITLGGNQVDSEGNYIESCSEAEVKYRALDSSLAQKLTRIDISDYANEIASKLGAISIYNTGTYAAYRACLNTNVDVYFTGVDDSYFTDKATAYTEADSFLRDEKVYHIVPLSQKTSIHQIFDANVDYCSTADVGLWRTTWLSRKLIDTEGISSNTTIEDSSEGLVGVNVIDSSATFIADGVQAGDKLFVESWSKIIPVQKDEYISTNAGLSPVVSWDASTNTLTIAEDITSSGATSLTGSISDLIGRTMKITAVEAGNSLTLTSSDTDSFYDESHANGTISQTFAELGYKIKNAMVLSGSTKLLLEAIGSGINLDDAGGNDGFTLTFYDSILTKKDEDLFIKNGTTVNTVFDTNTLILDSGIKSGFAPIYTGLKYSVQRAISKDNQAESVASYAASYADRRVRFVWPDQGLDDSGNTMYGYFLAAETAGRYSGMPVQESLTRHTVSSCMYTLEHSNGYFSTSQLNKLAEGGVTIFTQTTDGANPMCRHQQTSDRSTVYYTEPSITHAVDKYSYKVATMFDKLIGVFNITQQLFDAATLYHEGIKKEMLKPKPKIGSELKSINLVSMSQDTTDIDYVACETEVQPQVPCNGFKVTVKVK